MERNVLLSIRGTQCYDQQDPDVIELVTEGTMTRIAGGWELCYEESALTGLEGVTTTFRIEEDKVILRRTGKLRSQMLFQLNVSHESLYQLPFGALLITVCAQKIAHELDEQGGTVDLEYSINVENSAAGTVDYHLDVRPLN